MYNLYMHVFIILSSKLNLIEPLLTCIVLLDLYSYSSRECQIQDWPTHRLKCSIKKTTSSKPVSGDGSSNSHRGQDQDLANGESKTSKEAKGHHVQYCQASGDHSAATTSNNESKQCAAKSADSSCSSSSADSYKDPVTITVKTSKQRHQLMLDKQSSSGEDLLQDIANKVHIPLSKLKLIHKGRIVTAENIGSVLSNRAVFQAIGEVAESEEGLRTKDIDCVMDRIKVDRNTAIKALRQTGDVVDAILYLGNL